MCTTSTVWAGTVGPATNNASSSAWSVGVQALYLQAKLSANNLLGTVSQTGIAGDPLSLTYPSAADAWR